MGFSTRDTSAMQPKERTIHPVWRGIGFLLIIITPLMGYAVATLIVGANKIQRWVAIPTELIADGKNPDLYVLILLTVVVSFLIYMVLSLLTFFVMSLISPPRYGPQDVPPAAYRGKRYKR